MIDEGMVMLEDDNVFDIVARESLQYDIFINSNMLGKVNPLSPVSVFVCHFPDRKRSHFFHVDKYTHLLINGDYTGKWGAQALEAESHGKDLSPCPHVRQPQFR